jgi:type I restriction enzyme S subunit
MSHTGKLTPKLRFPEFREEWEQLPLSDMAVMINDRVGTSPCVPYTVTSGVGLVSQDKKFGRTIAGNSLKNYIRLRNNDFAYNKSATKLYPEGYIARFVGDSKAGVPNSIFTCFRADSQRVNPAYLDYLFASNLHGRWLRKFLTIGARAHGALNVSDDDLMALPVPLPAGKQSLSEQQKIAECLTSLGDLIAAEGRKLESLRAYKKGLMQQLFPRDGETTPHLRFPDFRGDGVWKDEALADLCTATISYGIVQAGPHVPNGMPYIKSTDLNSPLCLGRLACTSDVIAEKYQRSEVVPGDLVFSLRGNIGVARIVPAEIRVANLTQGTARIRTRGSSAFYLQALQSQPVHAQILAVSKGSTFQEISLEHLRKIRLRCPGGAEQQRIADCLFSLDAQIAAQTERLAALRTHKKGLMQQLFPSATEAERSHGG